VSAADAGAPAVARAERELVGETVGAFAHEANNRIATLAETAGLVGDLLDVTGAGRAGAGRDAARAAEGMGEQLAQLAALVRRLAGFAAAVGTAGPTDAGAALADLAALAERGARRRGVALRCETAAGLPPVPAPPAVFLALAHRLVGTALACSPSGTTLRLAAARSGGGLEVRLTAPAAAAAALAGDAPAQALAGAIGASLAADPAAGEIRVRFAAQG